MSISAARSGTPIYDMHVDTRLPGYVHDAKTAKVIELLLGDPILVKQLNMDDFLHALGQIKTSAHEKAGVVFSQLLQADQVYQPIPKHLPAWLLFSDFSILTRYLGPDDATREMIRLRTHEMLNSPLAERLKIDDLIRIYIGYKQHGIDTMGLLEELIGPSRIAQIPPSLLRK